MLGSGHKHVALHVQCKGCHPGALSDRIITSALTTIWVPNLSTIWVLASQQYGITRGEALVVHDAEAEGLPDQLWHVQPQAATDCRCRAAGSNQL